MKIVIIIPVYKEVEPLKRFLPELKNHVESIPDHDIYTLVFDSNSEDGTTELLEEWQKSWDKLLFLTEKQKTGLGSAYLQAMDFAIHFLNAHAVLKN